MQVTEPWRFCDIFYSFKFISRRCSICIVFPFGLLLGISSPFHEMDFESRINDSFSKKIDSALRTEMRDQIRDRVCSVFGRMKISVDITDNTGSSSITR